jgi:hypothetical protein
VSWLWVIIILVACGLQQQQQQHRNRSCEEQSNKLMRCVIEFAVNLGIFFLSSQKKSHNKLVFVICVTDFLQMNSYLIFLCLFNLFTSRHKLKFCPVCHHTPKIIIVVKGREMIIFHLIIL